MALEVMNVSKFSKTIEEIVVEKRINYMDAIVWYCETNEMEVEVYTPKRKPRCCFFHAKLFHREPTVFIFIASCTCTNIFLSSISHLEWANMVFGNWISALVSEEHFQKFSTCFATTRRIMCYFFGKFIMFYFLSD